MMDTVKRAHWRSRIGFVLAASGSAVGLGNIWKFPYITGQNGGGIFVLVYLFCIVTIGLPVLIAEVLIGRSAQLSPVGAFKKLSRPNSFWQGVGWLGVVCAFVILSYYSVVAGWSLYYAWLSLTGELVSQPKEAIETLFGEVYANWRLNLFLHFVFTGLTVAIVTAGVKRGIEMASQVLMPVLLLLLVILFLYSTTTAGFGRALSFVFAPNLDRLSAAGLLEALGHSFFTLSVGMGAMLTYGSYLDEKADIVRACLYIAIIDTVVAIFACLTLFPITFTYGMAPDAGPGLVFIKIPLAFSQMPGGAYLAILFFSLVFFAALTSAISVLEVATSYFVDERGWKRVWAATVPGLVIVVLGIPSALSGGTELFGSSVENIFGKNWFDCVDYLASNWFLPLGALGMAVFVAWRIDDTTRRAAFLAGSTPGVLYFGWLQVLRYFVPIGIVVVFLHAIGLI